MRQGHSGTSDSDESDQPKRGGLGRLPGEEQLQHFVDKKGGPGHDYKKQPFLKGQAPKRGTHEVLRVETPHSVGGFCNVPRNEQKHHEQGRKGEVLGLPYVADARLKSTGERTSKNQGIN